MGSGRLEAFSDGVIAIIITIMVLDLKVAHGDTLAVLAPLLPTFLCYVLSFVYVGIYWNNHHHFFHAVDRVSGGVLWANLHLLFWMSLIPFVTIEMGENHFAAVPTALYGAVLLMTALAWVLLQLALRHTQGADSPLFKALGADYKGKLSPLLYVAGIAISFYHPWMAVTLYSVVAALWLIPDRRVERVVKSDDSAKQS